MKLLVILLFAFCFQVNAKTYSQSITLSEHNTSLKKIFRKIHRQTGCLFLFKDEWLNGASNVTIDVKNATLQEVLEICFKDQPISFTSVDNTIVVKKMEPVKADEDRGPPGLVIRGKVLDEKDQPAPGITVLVKGTQKRTFTNDDGEFTLTDISDNATLVFSGISFETRETKVGSKNNFIRVTLRYRAAALQDVIVIGYGSVRKADLTGSVERLSREDLTREVPSNVLQGMQGKLAGVNVTQNDGAPGAGISIRIRGSNSFLGGTEPLYVIDGVPFNNTSSGSTPSAIGTDEKQTGNALSFLDPNNIESIDILKDASATAIYGSRGANGVVIITTRRGQTGKDKVELNINAGLSQVSRKIPMLNAFDYATYRNAAAQNANDYEGQNYDLPFPGANRPVPGYPDSTFYAPAPNDFIDRSTDWQDVIFRKAYFQNYSINISGGNDAGNHSLSFNYLNQDGIVYNSNYRRYGINLNLNRNLGKAIKIGTSTILNSSRNNSVKTGTTDNLNGGGVVKAALVFPPTSDVKDPVTQAFTNQDFASNPYIYTRDVLNRMSTINIFTSNYAEVSLWKGLKFRQNIGFNYAYNLRDQYYPRTVWEGETSLGWGLRSTSIWNSFLSESILTYNKQFKKHSINITAGETYELTTGQDQRLEAKSFPNDLLQNENLAAGSVSFPPQNSKWRSTLISGFLRANYTYDDKYLLTVSYRRDGSSKFGKDNKWAGFPSFAVAWKVNHEKFMQQSDFFSDLKLRFSYGQSGNQGIGPYSSLSKLAVYNYPLGGSLQTGFADDYYAGPANDHLKWETTTAMNIGADIGLLKNRLVIHADLYRKKTDDLLQYIVTPNSTGFGRLLKNSGSVENKGLELVIEGQPISNNRLKWSSSFNITFNRNKILSLGGDVKQQFADAISLYEAPFVQQVGHPIGALYGWVEDGFYDNEAEVRNDPAYTNQPDAIIKRTVGEIKYKDLDGIPGITVNDRAFIGDVNPKYYFGFTNNFTYKNWDLSIFINGVQGNDIVNMNTRSIVTSPFTNTTQDMWKGAWTAGKTTTQASWPKPEQQFWRYFYFSRRFVEDGSFIRIKNVAVGYTVPHKLIGVTGLHVSFGIKNLYTFTNYSGYDPEINSFGDNPALFGVDLGGYPNARTYTFSVNCNF